MRRGTQEEPRSRRRPLAPRALVAVGAAAVLAAAVLAAPGTAVGQDSDPSTTTSVPTGTRSVATPTGEVAYATADGRVWVGTGNQPPAEIAQGAAIGRGGQAAVAISPVGNQVAFVRADGSLVIVPPQGGPATVLATDAVTSSLGRDPSIAWSPAGDRIAYLAVGTQEMVEPKPATPAPLSGPGVFRMPMPQGVLGDVVRVVTTQGVPGSTIGDPSVRSFVGVTSSLLDDLLAFDTVIPSTDQRYTLALGAFGSTEEIPTLLSLDDPVFSPDGRFVFGVAPAKGSEQLVQVSAETLDRTTLATDTEICNPAPSPDGSRIVFGAGDGCSGLSLVVTGTGGPVVDVTPPGTADTATFGVGELGWTAEGRFITTPDCRADAGRIDCDRPTMFLDPDTGRVLDGPRATTVAPARVPLALGVYADVHLRGPLEVRRSFPIDADLQGQLTETGDDGGRIEGRLVDGGAVMELNLQVESGAPFATGTVAVTDPEAGIDRTFTVLAKPGFVGTRAFSLDGIWFSTEDLPFATGRFSLAIRRR